MTATSLNPYAAMSLATITYDDEGGTLAQQKVAMSADLSNLPAYLAHVTPASRKS